MRRDLSLSSPMTFDYSFQMHPTEIVWLVLGALCSILSLTYILLVMLNCRSHQRHNLITINLALSIFIAVVFWCSSGYFQQYYLEKKWPHGLCIAFLYLQSLATFEIPLSMIAGCLHWLLVIKYHTVMFFRKQRFLIICIILQQVLGIILALPFLWPNKTVSCL
jgi:hypothetical protein